MSKIEPAHNENSEIEYVREDAQLLAYVPPELTSYSDEDMLDILGPARTSYNAQGPLNDSNNLFGPNGGN